MKPPRPTKPLKARSILHPERRIKTILSRYRARPLEPFSWLERKRCICRFSATGPNRRSHSVTSEWCNHLRSRIEAGMRIVSLGKLGMHYALLQPRLLYMVFWEYERYNELSWSIARCELRFPSVRDWRDNANWAIRGYDGYETEGRRICRIAKREREAI